MINSGYMTQGTVNQLGVGMEVMFGCKGSGNIMALDVLRAIGRDEGQLDQLLELLNEELGGGSSAATDVLRAAVSVTLEDEGSARMLTEQLALTAAAAALKREYPPIFAESFVETRLGRPWRATYGMLDARFDLRAVLDYICPAL